MRTKIIILLALPLVLAACSGAPQALPIPTQTATEQSAPTATTAPMDAPSPSPQTSNDPAGSPGSEDLVRIDEQGNVVVEITPANLSSPGDALEFEVVLNTHSVDLSMDLAPLSTLTTDTGKSVQASLWDAPLGGHHVSGRLIFPATVDGQPFLAGAKTLTLTIQNLDSPERVFTWELSS